MDELKVNFENKPQVQPEQKQAFDDFSDLEPIKVSATAIKKTAYKQPSDTINFGPITGERLILAASCLMALSMFLPWMTLTMNFFGYVDSTKFVQFDDNRWESIFVLVCAAATFFAAIKYEKKKLYYAIAFFAASAGFIIRNHLKVREKFSDPLAMLQVEYNIGFYVYLVAVIFMVLAIILKLIDKD